MIKKVLNNAFAKNSLILFAGTMVANIIGYVFHFVIGRMVSIPVYGEVESLVSLIAIISVPSGALTMVATKFSAINKAESDKAGSYELIRFFNKKLLIYGLPIFLLAIALSSIVKNFLKLENSATLVIVWMIMFLSFFSSITGGVLVGWQKFKESSWAGIWGSVAKLVFAVIFVKIGFAAGGVIAGYAFGLLVSYFFTIYFLSFVWKNKKAIKNQVGRIDFESVKKYVYPVFWGNLAIAILSNADMVVAKHALDENMAGQYGALTIVSKIIFFGTGIIATVLFSMSAEQHHKKGQSAKTFRHALLIMAVLSVVAIIIYALFPQLILFMLFGNKYQDVASYLIWFAVSVTLFSFVNLIFQYLMSIHRTKIAYWLMLVAVLAVVMTKLFGSSISAIIGIMAAFQVLGVFCGIWFLLSKKKEEKRYE